MYFPLFRLLDCYRASSFHFPYSRFLQLDDIRCQQCTYTRTTHMCLQPLISFFFFTMVIAPRALSSRLLLKQIILQYKMIYQFIFWKFNNAKTLHLSSFLVGIFNRWEKGLGVEAQCSAVIFFVCVIACACLDSHCAFVHASNRDIEDVRSCLLHLEKLLRKTFENNAGIDHHTLGKEKGH